MPSLSGLRAVAFGAIGAIGAMLACGPASGATLKVGGTGGATELLRQLAVPFEADTGIVLEVIAGLGTSGANNALGNDKLGLAVSGRHLKDSETAKGLREAVHFDTPYGLVTSREEPQDLKRSEIVGLYRSDRPLWPDGMPILITLRPVDESDNATLGELSPGVTEALVQLRKRPDLSIAATDQDNADTAERVKGSMAGATLTQIVNEKRNLRFVAIDGVPLTLENYENGSYPYAKQLYVIVPATVSPEAEALIAFLAKLATEALLRRAGIVAGK